MAERLAKQFSRVGGWAGIHLFRMNRIPHGPTP